MHTTARIFSSTSSRIVSVAALSLLLAGVFTACGKVPSNAPIAGAALPATKLPTNISLTIVAQGPDKSIEGPAYGPMTNLTLPAHTLVTFTIVNNDPGDTPLTQGSPFNVVTGVTGGAAYVDGVAYNRLAPDKIAHTFTVPSLGVSVPVPGDVPAGQKTITVTFSFMTGAAGTYYWQCMDPCGSGASGWGGPMTTSGYMKGVLTVR